MSESAGTMSNEELKILAKMIFAHTKDCAWTLVIQTDESTLSVISGLPQEVITDMLEHAVLLRATSAPKISIKVPRGDA